jgi:hypothetical protein
LQHVLNYTATVFPKNKEDWEKGSPEWDIVCRFWKMYRRMQSSSIQDCLAANENNPDPNVRAVLSFLINLDIEIQSKFDIQIKLMNDENPLVSLNAWYFLSFNCQDHSEDQAEEFLLLASKHLNRDTHAGTILKKVTSYIWKCVRKYKCFPLLYKVLRKSILLLVENPSEYLHTIEAFFNALIRVQAAQTFIETNPSKLVRHLATVICSIRVRKFNSVLEVFRKHNA